MAMTARTWKYVGSATPAANTVAGIADALYSLCTSATYYNGASRTPGSGVAVTGVQHQVGGTTECIEIAPVTNPHTVRYLVSGSASARTPTMVTSPFTDTWTTGCVLLGFARSWNSYNATGNGWDQALPGGVGSAFTGYVRAFNTGPLTATKVHLFECADGFAVGIQQAAAVSWFGAGLDIDPRVTNGTSPASAEATSGGRYMMWNSSSSGAVPTAIWNTTLTNTASPWHTSAANVGHAYVLSVGGVTLAAVSRDATLTTATDTTAYVNDDGDWIPREIEIVKSSSLTSVGRLREMRIGPDRKLGDTFSVSGTVKAYALSSHPSSDNDTLWLIA
jgi:hypothetical protein